ncbi:MAG: hypothetical protein R3B90_06200 [Planctomycetaceae bacterium]
MKDSEPEVTSTPGEAAAGQAPTGNVGHESQSVATSSASLEGLPEAFEWTPELVEEEAIRGDIMLRGAVILLAILFGWTHITSSETLVSIRSGAAILENGGLPPRTDTLSYTAADRAWVNLDWLGDLLLAGLHAVGTSASLSVFTAAICGLTFWLIGRISVTNLPTWWGSICAAVAAVATFPLMTAGPTVITLLGLALTLWQLQRWQERPADYKPWGITATLWAWCQLDPRAYLGLTLVLLFALGRWFTPRRTEAAGQIGLPALAAVAAALVHPFHIHVLLSPYKLLTQYAPLMRTYGGENAAEYPYLWQPVKDALSQSPVSWHLIAAIVLAVLGLLALALNRQRIDWSWLLPFVGLNLFGLFSGIDLAAVAIVSAVVATLNAQEWYGASCRQEYTLDKQELLFSRAGRAVTVLCLFATAYWSLSGHMTGAAGRRVGFGFSSRLQTRINGYQSLLGTVGTDEFDDHPYHVTPQQGDVLVWLGRRSFTDSRLTLFAEGETNLLERQRELSGDMLSPGQALTTTTAIAEWANKWRSGLDAYDITHAVVPLESPDGYQLWVNMATQGTQLDDGSVARFWMQDGVGGPAAVLYRLGNTKGRDNQALDEFLTSRASQSTLIAQTFRARPDGEPVRRGLFPRNPTFYETSLLLPEPTISNDSLTARHYSTRLSLQQRSVPETIAFAHQIIRHARRGLAEDPNSFETYLLLGDGYMRLWGAESTLVGNPLAHQVVERRFHQAIFAWHHASMCRPSDPQPHGALAELYSIHGDDDLALRHLDRLYELTGYYTPSQRGVGVTEQSFSQAHQNGKRLREALSEQVNAARDAADRAQLGGLESAIRVALTNRIPGFALELLERDLTLTAQSLDLTEQHVRLLLLVGRTEEAYEQAERQVAALERAGVPPPPQLQSARLLAARANIAADQYERATRLLEQYCDEQLKTVYDRMLPMMPCLAPPGESGDPWAVYQIVTAAEGLGRWLPEWEAARLQIALNELEEDRNLAAESMLESIIVANPQTLLRPQVGVYLMLLTGQDLTAESSAGSPPAGEPAVRDEDAVPANDGSASGRPVANQPAATIEAVAEDRPPSPALPRHAQ